MITIIAGSRDATRAGVFAAMTRCPWTAEITEVVSGAARGADTFGEEWAAVAGVSVRRMPADWTTHGRSAGHRRNDDMAAVAHALVAVWDGISPGTKHMIAAARKRGLRVFVWSYEKGVGWS